MKPVAPVFLLLLYSFFAAAQNPLVKQWDYRYGGNSYDDLSIIYRTTDDGFILGGSSTSDSSADITEQSRGFDDFWVVKTNPQGIKQWDKRFGGTYVDWLLSLQETRDGGYILGGSSWSGVGADKTEPSQGGLDYWMIKTDLVGNKQWDKRFGGTLHDMLASIHQTADGGYILGGISQSGIGGDKTEPIWDTLANGWDYWMVKTDSAGNKQWDKRFGGIAQDVLAAVQQTTDGGYILGGFSSSGIDGDKTEMSRGEKDYWIVKTDGIGNKQWDRRFGGTLNDQLYALQQTIDGGYILGGVSESDSSGDKTEQMLDTEGFSDFWVVKVDSSGIKQWDKKFGGTRAELVFNNVSQTTDGGFLLAGNSYSGISGDKSEDNLSNEQTWVVKTDATGHKQWDKTLHTVTPLDDECGYAIQVSDGCYLIGNSTWATLGGDKTQDSLGGEDYWIIEFCDTSFHCNLAPAVVTASQTIFCASDSAQICAPAGMAAYQWNTGSAANCITTSQAGNYYVTVTDNSGCTATSNHLAITVHPSPPVSISVNGDTLSAYNAVVYQWLLNGNAITGATNSVYIVQQPGLYSVAVTDSNGCYATSNAVTFTGIDETTVTWSAISIYPSPTTNQLFIQSKNEPVIVLNIYNTSGELIAKIDQPESPGINVADFAAGVYVVEIKTCSGSFMRRWVKM